MLLCIEMAFFAVFHLWAFPWTVYDIHKSSIVAGETAAGFMPDSKTAYQGGKFGERALMEAFNPWDLIKAVGRGFRWAAVGRRKRLDDVSYKAHGAGLEPTRNQFTAFDSQNNTSLDYPDSAYYNSQPSKSSNYYTADSDQDNLLKNAQSNPTSNYPRPMSRQPARDPALGYHDSNTHQGPNTNPNTPFQDRTGHLAPQSASSYGILTPESSSQDTGYHTPRSHSRNVSGESTHRREHNLTPTAIPPDATPLGPPGRKSSEQAEWDLYGGRGHGEDERDLGGGHGVGDNRF